MYNTSLWNVASFGGSGSASTPVITDLIAFEDLSLADNVNIICEDLEESMAEREMDMTSVPLADGMHINSMYERAKLIKSRHHLIQSSSATLEAYIDTIKNKLSTQEGNLYITRNGNTRKYLATLRNTGSILADRARWDIDTAPLTLEWVCHDGYGEDIAYSIKTKSTSTSPDTLIVYNSGTAKARPVFVVVFNAASSVTAFKIGNDTTGEEIKYTGALAANNALIFDPEEGTLTLNGTAVAYTGSFLSLPVGFSTLRFTVTGTSFTIAVTVKWKRRWR